MNRNTRTYRPTRRLAAAPGPLRLVRPGTGLCILLTLAALLGTAQVHAAPFSTAITYQGTLEDGGLPANGPVDFQFRLFDAPAAGTQIGSTVTANGVLLEDGAFTIELDFGAPAAFDGQERWLEIVANGTTLSPRQRLSPAPYANLSQSFAIPQSITTDVNLPFGLINTNPTAQARGMRVAVTSTAIGAIALFGEATSTANENVGVLGRSSSSNGFGVAGDNLSTTGNCTGVYGNVASTTGSGVFGYAHSPSGATRGVYGKVESPSGHTGYFEGRGYVSDNLGVGVTGAAAKLEISGQDPVTGQALNANDQLYVVASPTPFVGVGRTTQVTSLEVFGIHADRLPNSYGGVYVETSDVSSLPFYGYATNGVARAWTYFDGVRGMWRLHVGGAVRLNVDGNGLTGIGRIPAANFLEVEGNASKTTAGSWLANSDARIKTDVATIGHALATLDKVRLVSFRYNDDYRAAHPDIKDHRYLNVIAQEFREVFPDQVQGSGEKLPDGEEILQVDTCPLTIYTAAAVQELHRTLAEKNSQIAGLEARVAKLEGLVTQLAAATPGTLVVAAAISASPAGALPYELDWRTLDGGGGTAAAAALSLSGTIGQPDAGRMSAGALVLRGGYWRGGATASAIGGPGEGSGDLSGGTVSVFLLHGAWPNPFNQGTNVAFDLPAACLARLEILDLDGRLVRTLVAGQLAAGRHRAPWDGRNERGDPSPNGVYLARLVAGDRSARRKLLLTH